MAAREPEFTRWIVPVIKQSKANARKKMRKIANHSSYVRAILKAERPNFTAQRHQQSLAVTEQEDCRKTEKEQWQAQCRAEAMRKEAERQERENQEAKINAFLDTLDQNERDHVEHAFEAHMQSEPTRETVWGRRRRGKDRMSDSMISGYRRQFYLSQIST